MNSPSKKINLLDKLTSVDTQKKLLRCALDYDQPCCKGKGYQVVSQGAYARGEICSCLKNCPQCLGKLFKKTTGGVIPCTSPNPSRICSLLNEADIPARYAHAELRNFSNRSGNCGRVLHKVTQWVSRYKELDRGLILSGPIGVGKTFILTALAKNLIQNGVSVKFVDFFQLVGQIRAGYSDQKSDQTFLKPLINVDVLIIDELGKGRNTDFELTVLDQLVMGRYNQNKIIVASTNCYLRESPEPQRGLSQKKLDQLSSSQQPQRALAPETAEHLSERVGPRVFSRLTETTYFIEMLGDDYRQKKGSPWFVS